MENTEQVPAQEPTVAVTPTPTPAEAAPSVPVSDTPQPTVEAEKKIKVAVSIAPKNKKQDLINRKEWLAKVRQENQEALKNAGYKPDAIVEILRFMSGSDAKYPYAKGLKNPLVHMLASVANGLHYQTATWGSGDVSQLICLLVEVNGIFANKDTKVGDKEFMKASGDEAMKFIRGKFDDAWTRAKVMCNQNLARAKAAILRAINSPKRPDAIPARCRYLLECIIEITMNMVDPFEGVFHDSVVEVPEELKGKIMSYEELKEKRAQQHNGHYRKGGKPNQPPREPAKCQKCGENLTWIREIHRNICTNVMCVWGTTKEEAIERYGGKEDRPRYSKGGKKGKDSFHYKGGDGNETMSDKFKARYAKKAADRVVASVVPTEEKIVKDKDGNEKKVTVKKAFSGSAGVWDALDSLKIADAPAETPAPAAEAPANPPPPENPPAE